MAREQFIEYDSFRFEHEEEFAWSNLKFQRWQNHETNKEERITQHGQTPDESHENVGRPMARKIKKNDNCETNEK